MHPRSLTPWACCCLIVFIIAVGLNVHGAEPFGFEQDQRINQLTLQFGTDTFATANAFGHAFGSVAQSQLQASIAQAITDVSISLLFTFPGLADLAGTNAPSLTLGVVSAAPILPGGNPAQYSGTSDLDWWYLLDILDLTADGTPLQQVPGSISNRVLNANLGRLTFEPSPLSPGADAALSLFSTVLTASNGPASMPLQSTNNFPPGHSPGEGISPALVSFGTMTQGQLKGNISALSLANTPVPAAMAAGGATACTQNYGVTNSYLDLIVGGCTVFIVTAIIASQPDRFDTNAPVAGAGPPYTFTRTGTRVTGAHDHLGATVSLQTALAASGYSAYFKFTCDRVVAFTRPNSAPRIVHTSKLAHGPFHLAFAAAPQATYTVMATTNVGLPSTNWTALGNPTQTMFGLFEMTDSTTNLPQRFYRVRSP